MGLSFFTFREYIRYRLQAVNAHGLHSPFLFQLYNEVIRTRNKEAEKQLDSIRNSIFSSKGHFKYINPKNQSVHTEEIGTWARRVTSCKKFSLFLIGLINWLEIETVLETGTAAGINAVSMAISGAKKIITIEGSAAIAAIAEETIANHGKQKVTLVKGNVLDTFEETLIKFKPKLIFLDADHRSETIQFYLKAIKKSGINPKCILIHDIHWSRDMNVAWKNCVSNPAYNLTIDLFQVGLVFPNHPMEKQHFSIQF